MIAKIRRRLEDPLCLCCVPSSSSFSRVIATRHLLHDDESPARVRAEDLLAVGSQAQRGVARRVAGLLPVENIQRLSDSMTPLAIGGINCMQYLSGNIKHTVCP